MPSLSIIPLKANNNLMWILEYQMLKTKVENWKLNYSLLLFFVMNIDLSVFVFLC